MKSDRLELMPGVWLNIVQTNRFKTGCFSINFMRPLMRETAAPNALLPSVLLRGCKSFPDMEAVSNQLDTLYGASAGTLVRKKGEVQTVGLYADFLEDRYAGAEPVYEQMMKMIRELLFAPCMEDGGFLPEYLESERCNLINTIDSKINDKRTYAVSSLIRNMCAGEAYAVPRLGEKDTLSGLSGQSLYALWQEMLRTSRVELFYLGQKSKEEVTGTLHHMLSELPRSEMLSAVRTVPALPDRPVRYVEEAMDVTQGKLSLGFRSGITACDARYPALLLLNAIYGAGMTSKLFMKIREEQSLCYYANSSLDKFKGVMIVSSGIDFDQYETARDGILHQLELCKRGDITSQEMESARNYLISSLRTGNDSPGRLDDYAIGQAVAGLQGTMEDLAQQLQQVTLDQVMEAANTLRLDTVYFLKGVER